MNFLQAINTYLWTWLEALKSIRRPAVLLPFLLFSLLEVLLLWSAGLFHQPGIGNIWIPILTATSGPISLHYPQFYLLLSGLVFRLDLVLTALVGQLMAGWGALALRDLYVGERRGLGKEFGAASRFYLLLLAVGALGGALNFLLSQSYSVLPREWFVGYARRQEFLTWALFVLNALIQCVLVYIPFQALVAGHSAGSAFREGIRFFGRHFFMTFLLVLLPMLPPFLLGRLADHPQALAVKFEPEMLMKLWMGVLLLGGLCTYLLNAATLRFFLYRTRLDRPAGTGAADAR